MSKRTTSVPIVEGTAHPSEVLGFDLGARLDRASRMSALGRG